MKNQNDLWKTLEQKSNTPAALFLKYVPPEEQTAAVALAAVSQRPDALLWVLDQTDEVCKKAIAGRASAVQWIRDEGQKSRLEKKNTPTM